MICRASKNGLSLCCVATAILYVSCENTNSGFTASMPEHGTIASNVFTSSDVALSNQESGASGSEGLRYTSTSLYIRSHGQPIELMTQQVKRSAHNEILSTGASIFHSDKALSVVSTNESVAFTILYRRGKIVGILFCDIVVLSPPLALPSGTYDVEMRMSCYETFPP